MKHNIAALKLYLVGLAIGLFILGWALVVRLEAARFAQQEAERRALVEQAGSDGALDSGASDLEKMLGLQPIPTLPPIRTRTS
jgi:hypothetical protein